VSVFRSKLKKKDPPKRWKPITSLHDVTTQNNPELNLLRYENLKSRKDITDKISNNGDKADISKYSLKP